MKITDKQGRVVNGVSWNNTFERWEREAEGIHYAYYPRDGWERVKEKTWVDAASELHVNKAGGIEFDGENFYLPDGYRFRKLDASPFDVLFPSIVIEKLELR